MKSLILALAILGGSICAADVDHLGGERKSDHTNSDSRVVNSSLGESFVLLPAIDSVTKLLIDRQEKPSRAAQVSVFEMQFGDAANNGDEVFLSICPLDRMLGCVHFEKVVALRSVSRVWAQGSKHGPETIVIEGDEDYEDGGDQLVRDVKYDIQFDWNENGTIQDHVTVKRRQD